MTGLLDRIADIQARSRSVVELTENGPPVLLKEEYGDLLRTERKDRLALLDLSLVVDQGPSLLRLWLKPGKRVGSARYGYGRKTLDIIVQPKVGLLDLVRILRAADSSLGFSDQISTSYLNLGQPLPLLLQYVLHDIYAFLTSRPLRTFRYVDDDGSRKPRGKIKIGRYVRHHVPRGLYDQMPCRYVDLGTDSEENRAIRFTVRLIQRLSNNCPATNRKQLDRSAVACLQLLPGVTDVWFTAAQLAAVKPLSRDKRLASVLSLCRMVVSGATISLTPGQSVEFFAFQIDMPTVFERYVRGAFYDAGQAVGYTPSYRLTHLLGGAGKEIRLDGRLVGERPCIMETKYKLVQDIRDLNYDEGAIANADIYQAVAYTGFKATSATRAFLVYPRLGGGPAVEVVAPIVGFANHLGDIDLSVVLVNLSSQRSHIVEGFSRELEKRR